MNIQGQPRKYGHLIVAGGTVIALIGFLFLPYVTMSSTTADSSSQSFSSEGIASLPFTMSAIRAASYQGFIWLEALLAVGLLLTALLLAYSRNPFGMSKVALDKQVQRGVYALIGVGVVSLLLQYVLTSGIPGALMSMTTITSDAGATPQASPAVAMDYSAGSWFYVVGMLAVIGGATYVLMQMRPAQVAPAASYVPPAQYPQMNQQNAQPQPPSAPPYQQNWQDPAQSQPTQLSQGQYPNQQQWQQPQPPTGYPPTQQAWPPQQPQPPYPPTSQG